MQRSPLSSTQAACPSHGCAYFLGCDRHIERAGAAPLHCSLSKNGFGEEGDKLIHHGLVKNPATKLACLTTDKLCISPDDTSINLRGKDLNSVDAALIAAVMKFFRKTVSLKCTSPASAHQPLASGLKSTLDEVEGVGTLGCGVCVVGVRMHCFILGESHCCL